MREQLWRLIDRLPIVPRLRPPRVVMAGVGFFLAGMLFAGLLVDGLVNDVTIVLSLPIVATGIVALIRRQEFGRWAAIAILVLGILGLAVQGLTFLASVEHSQSHGGVIPGGDLVWLNLHGIAVFCVILAGLLAILRPSARPERPAGR